MVRKLRNFGVISVKKTQKDQRLNKPSTGYTKGK